jgi:hypothetical protein
VGEMGQEKSTGEIKNTHKISFGIFERKRQFWRSKYRWKVKEN